MVAATQWLRIWVFSMEVPALKAGKFFRPYSCTFYPTMTVLLECFDPVIYSCVVLPCNSITVNAISYKPQKVWAMMVSLYSYILKLFP